MNNEVIFMRVFAEKSSLQCLMALRLAGSEPVTQQRFTLYTDLDRSTVRRGLARLASMGLAARGGTRANPNWLLTAAAQQMITQLFSAPPAPAMAAEPALANVGAAHRAASCKDRGRPRHGAPSRSDRARRRNRRQPRTDRVNRAVQQTGTRVAKKSPSPQPDAPPSTADIASAPSATPAPATAPRHRGASPRDRAAPPRNRAAKQSPPRQQSDAPPSTTDSDSAPSATSAPATVPRHPARRRHRRQSCSDRAAKKSPAPEQSAAPPAAPLPEAPPAAPPPSTADLPTAGSAPTAPVAAPIPRHRGRRRHPRQSPRDRARRRHPRHSPRVRAAKKSPHAVRAIQSALSRADQPEPRGRREELNIVKDIYTDSPPHDPESARQLRAAVRAGGVFPTLRTPLIDALLADDGPAWVRHALGWICHVRRDRPKTPIGGIVYPMLSQRRLCDDEYLPPPDMTFDEALAWALNGGPEPEPPEPEWGDDDDQDLPAPPEPPRPPTPEEALWQSLLARVKLEVKRELYELHLARTRLLHLSAEACTVGVPNNWARDVLVHRLDATVRTHLASLLGRWVQVSYECMAQ